MGFRVLGYRVAPTWLQTHLPQVKFVMGLTKVLVPNPLITQPRTRRLLPYSPWSPNTPKEFIPKDRRKPYMTWLRRTGLSGVHPFKSNCRMDIAISRSLIYHLEYEL